MIGVLWAYEGWQYVTFSAGETRDPQRTFPRAHHHRDGGARGALPARELGLSRGARTHGRGQQRRTLPPTRCGRCSARAAGKVVGALILVSIFSAANGLFLTTPRMYFAMARDGVFFERLAVVHPRFGTPAFAIVAIAVWSALLAATGTFEQLLTYVVFTGWIFYALGALSIFVYRRRSPNARAAVPRAGLSGHAAALRALRRAARAEHVVTQPGRAAAGIGVVLLGAPAFFVWRSRARRRQSDTPLSDAPAVS